MDNNQANTTIPWYPPVQSEPIVDPLVQNNITVSGAEPLVTAKTDASNIDQTSNIQADGNISLNVQNDLIPEPKMHEPVISDVQEPVMGDKSTQVSLPPVPNTSTEPLKEVPMTPVMELTVVETVEEEPQMPWQLGPTGNVQNWW